VGLILAFAAGYFVGARGGNEGFEEVVAAARAVGESQEVEDLLRALRSHAGHALQELGKRLGSEADEPLTISAILEGARGMFQREATETAF
jgi:hypothetical protein